MRKPLDGAATTDAEGIAQVAVTLPPVTQTAKPLEASVILRLRESGGRTIERSLTMPVDLKQARIGIKPLFKGTDLDEKQTARSRSSCSTPTASASPPTGSTGCSTASTPTGSGTAATASGTTRP